MPVVADDSGVVRGTFQIPAGIPAGTKKVELVGAAGSYGASTFTGSGTVEVQQMRTVEVIETHFYDPLAQTFTLDVGRHLGGIDLWFTAVGSQPVRVQIRETTVGFPSRVVLAEGSIPANQIRTDGQPTRITWTPLWCPAGSEYALVILTDDATHAVAVAQLGKFDRFAQKWVTQQPYTTGVLLSSSNASTWTPHQDLDLTFRLLACRFTATAKRIPLGTITANQVSDMIALARVERPAVDTNLTLVFTDQDGDQLTVVDGQVVSLQNRLNGNVTVEAVLTGSDLRSPVLYPGVQAVLGNVKESATYVSRLIDCPGATKVIVAYEALLGGPAAVKVEVLRNGGWTVAPVTGGSPIGNGWQETICTLSNFAVDQTAVRLTLSGSIVYRPRLRNLQVVGL
jgi:dipeptidyl aminopeptidase/acylaminoacyl peptidase